MFFAKFSLAFLLFSAYLFPVEAVITSAKPSTAAYASDAFSGVENPGQAVLVGNRFDIGFTWIRQHQRSSIHGVPPPNAILNGKFNASRTNNYYFPTFAINRNFCSYFCNRCWEWSLSLMIYNNEFIKSTYNTAVPFFGTSHLGFESLEEVIATVFSCKLNECHSVGISIDTYVNRKKVNGIEAFAPLSLDPTHLTNKGYSFAYGLGATYGWRWQITEAFSFGASVRPKVRFKYHKYKGLFPNHGELDVPLKIRAGISYWFNPKFAVVFDVVWYNWRNTTARNRNITNTHPLGSKKGSSVAWKNEIVYVIGAGYKVTDNLTVYARYSYDPTPVRRTETLVNMLPCSTVENNLLVGLSYMCGCNELALAYQHSFEHKIKGHHSMPAPLGGGNANISQRLDYVVFSLGHQY